MKLQGQVSSNSTARVVYGAIWQVLLVFRDLLKGLEEARQRQRPIKS